MAFQVKYKIEFDDQLEEAWTIDIFTDPWAGAVTYLKATGNPLTFLYDNDSDDIFDPIRPSYVNIEVYSIANFDHLALCSVEERQIFIQIYKGIDIVWNGFIEPMEYIELYEQPPYGVRLVASDGLRDLKSIMYDDAGTPYSGRKTEVVILRDIFTKVHSFFANFYEYINIYDDMMDSAVGDSPMEFVQIDTDLFRGMTCYEVLSHILIKYNAVIRQKNKYHIFRPTELTGATIYGRSWTGPATSIPVSYSPKQEINRVTEPSFLQQVPGGSLMMQRPISKVTINQDYGNRQSWLDSWQFKAEDYNGTNFLGWTLTASEAGDKILPAAELIAGEDLGAYVYDNDIVPVTLPYNYQLIGEGHVYSTTDRFTLSFEYGFFNTAVADKYSQLLMYVVCGSKELKEVAGNNALLEWDASGVIEIWDTIEKGWTGWREYKRDFIGIPDIDDMSIRLYGTQWIQEVYALIRNIVIKAHSAEIAQLQERQTTRYRHYGGLHKSPFRRPEEVKTVNIVTILEKTYEATNDINGEEIQKDYILGDVIGSGIDNVLPQFMGALGIDFTETFTIAAARFVTDWAADYLATGVIVTSSGAGIIFTAFTAGNDFDGPTTITNATGILDGTVVNTQANQGEQVEIDTITLTGTGGTANVTVDGLTRLATFNNDLDETASDFTAAHAAAYATIDIDLTDAPGGKLVFTGQAGKGAFSGVSTCVNVSGDLAGTNADTQAYSAPMARIDTITLHTGGGTADILCNGYTRTALLRDGYSPTSNWNTRGGSEDKPLLEIIGDEIAAQGARPKLLIQMPIRETDYWSDLNIIGTFQDDLLEHDTVTRNFMMNRGKFYVKDRLWDIDLIEIL